MYVNKTSLNHVKQLVLFSFHDHILTPMYVLPAAHVWGCCVRDDVTVVVTVCGVCVAVRVELLAELAALVWGGQRRHLVPLLLIASELAHD